MKIVRTLSLAATMALILTFAVSAASWDFIYEGDYLPDTNLPEWDAFKAEMIPDVCEITGDNELHMTDTDSTVCFFQYAVDNAEAATVEARIKVLSQSGAGYSLFFGIEDGAIYTWVHLFPDRIELEGGDSFAVDMTEYHTLRIARDGDNVDIYVDGAGVIAGVPGGTGDRLDIVFGTGSTSGTSESYWDYLAFTTAGAFSPDELASPGEASPVAKSPKSLTTTWGAIK